MMNQSLHRLSLRSPAFTSLKRSIATSAGRCPNRPKCVPKAAQVHQRRTFWGSSSSTASPFAGSGAGQPIWETLDFLPQISPDLLPLFLAILLAARDDDDGSSAKNRAPLQEKLFTVEAIPSKGLGAIAKKDLQRGEVIITERPLAIWPTELTATQAQGLIGRMTPSAKKAYLSLANASDPSSSLDPILGIRATNGFNVELPQIPTNLVPAGLLQSKDRPNTASFIFPRIARINHSCLPNADHAMDFSKLSMSVYATTTIAAGEEINIEYMPSLVQMTTAQRQQALKRDFGFLCQCQVCGGSEGAVKASDQRRTEINAIVGALGQGNMPRQEMWSALERIKALLEAEGYKAMPEFDNPKISNAFVGFTTILQQQERNDN